MESKYDDTAPYVDDIDCIKWLEEIGMPQYTNTFMTNFTIGGSGYLSRKRLAQVRLQDFSYMNIQNYEHQKILLDHIRHTLKYTYQSPIRIRESQETAYVKLGIKPSEPEPIVVESIQEPADEKKDSKDDVRRRRPSMTDKDIKEDVQQETAESKAEQKKKKKQRRHTFDDKAWEAINKSRTADQTKAAVELIREQVAPAAPGSNDADSITSTKPKKQKLHRRRSTFNELDEISNAADKAALYGNLVQSFNSWQRELEKVQESQLTQLMSLLRCTGSNLLFVNDRSNELVSAINGKWLSVRMDQGIASHCAISGEIVNVPDAEADIRYNKLNDFTPADVTIKGLLCAPVKAIKAGGKIIGVMQMYNKTGSGIFDKNDEGVLQVCVERIADDVYDVFKELLSLNDSISMFGTSFFPASESQKTPHLRFMQSTVNSRSGIFKQNSVPLTDESVEGLRQRYLSFEVGGVSFMK
jgi:hypothetical protein